MGLNIKRETNFDKMLSDFITLPLDEEDKKTKNKALGRKEKNEKKPRKEKTQ
ncbi:SPJ_0845 family protein [Periweissella beninensis]|uniref:Uncharacterized protein n=1 Tax=Periweissella beninensis TaxID=504936 RepID=A0ABT0VI95_9LACO|nr:SPJ_0845 family protein [Periweissella beninensis]MBM7544241.1 hypothetical protein [Periweissella beninensis]MCM2437552.1 hypothetical protein [Periweissella beninensis]